MTTTDFQVLLFTRSYPFSSAAEDSFIDPELPYLKRSFSSVIIIPESLEGVKKDLPSAIKLETHLARTTKIRSFRSGIKLLLSVVTSSDFFKEIFKKPGKTLRIRSLLRIISYLGVAFQTKKWVLKYIKDNNIDLGKTIFYTYWLDETAFGIYLAKKTCPGIKVISRAHGIDLYEERSPSSYIPFRPEIFSGINQIFADSEKGKKYLSARYPDFITLFRTARLGVPEQKLLTKASEDGVFRIVSCSYLVPVKRIELLIRGLEQLGKVQADRIYEWIHIGDGPLRSVCEHSARSCLPRNVKYSFLGYLPEGGVVTYYQNNPVDVFMNVSSTEGTPVSIMEAQSCSIPVIATSVGGNSEIVTHENGILLPEDPKPNEISYAISILYNDRNLLRQKKKKSHENWNKNYNPDTNFQSFTQDLIKILKNQKDKIQIH
jgi:colanic acid/amylovoran biosynthesis glycosyltransferase